MVSSRYDTSDGSGKSGTIIFVERTAEVKSSFTFTLPTDLLIIKPVLRVTRSLRNKEYIATFAFRGGDGEYFTPSSTPTGIQWSTVLEKPFSYISAVTVEPSQSFALHHMPKFESPTGTQAIDIDIQQWELNDGPTESPFANATIETTILNRPVLIFSEETIRR